jgi:hypothetical protein
VANFATSLTGAVSSLILFQLFATVVNDTGGKFATGVNNANGKFWQFATDVNDTGGKQWEQYQTADNLN